MVEGENRLGIGQAALTQRDDRQQRDGNRDLVSLLLGPIVSAFLSRGRDSHLNLL